jgi:hypothetical protein
MQGSSSQLLIYGLVIAGFLLFNYFMQRMSRRAQEQERAQAREAASPQPEDEPLEDIWSRRTSVAAPPEPMPVHVLAPAPDAEAPADAPQKAHRSAAARRLFRTRRDLRRAVVMMTVLGPCRALEPPGRH